ncbi:MAG: hypothetical protein ONB16_02550 [candidate division KSB1 bacterium]|nr:hypothetical protein [candidate division KSB1 bacterium]MDZ7341037.1 hypothetical protein [candidate division KSB1 bacterium]
MKKVTQLSTKDVDRLLFGVPTDHKHCRLALITTRDECFILSEALVAAIVRAYVSLKTHPQLKTIEMNSSRSSWPKADFADYQLLESQTSSSDIEAELSELLGKADQ